MKVLRRLLVSLVLSLGLLVPLTAPAVHAQPVNLLCVNQDESFVPDGCDLSLDQVVSVNEGEFTQANTTASAISVQNGDTVTYRITITDQSDENVEVPTGLVTVTDILPASLTLKSFSTSTGTFNADTGAWTFFVEESLPATLVLTAQVNTSTPGLIANTATMTDYTPDNCDGGLCPDPPYVDANAANNSHVTYIIINGRVVAVTTISPKAPNTGFGIFQLNVWQRLAGSLVLASGLFVGAYALRRSLPKTD